MSSAVGGDGGASAAPVHPKIRQRRIAVRREAGRRRLRVLLAVLVVSGLAAAVAAALRSPLTDVDEVTITGVARTKPAAVEQAARLDRPIQLIDVDPSVAASRIEALPWVRDAHVTRRWPDGVEIRVSERRPALVAPVDDGARWALLDETGRVLATEPTRPPGYPALSAGPAPGAPGTTIAGTALGAVRVAAALPPSLRPTVGDVVVVGGDVELALLPHGRVLLGPAAGVGEKLAALATLLAAVDLDGVATIDVRVPSAPTVTRRGPADAAKP